MTAAARLAGALVVVAVAACGSSAGTGPSASPRPRPSATVAALASPSPTAFAPGTALTVLAPLGINLRDSGSPAGTVVGTLGQGTVVTVVSQGGQNNAWYQVKGEIQTGWISDDPAYTSPRHFEQYQSDTHGFSALYLDSWTFVEGPTVSFHPQSGGSPLITVAAGPTLDALGPAGMPGYTTIQIDSAEVYGITGVLKLFTRSSPAASPSPGQQPQPQLLAELRVTLDAHRAMRLDFLYASPDDLRTFRDFYGSIIVPLAESPGAAPTKAPA
jgi:hypothetical protein